MKRRLFSLCLALCLVAGLLPPLGALAVDTDEPPVAESSYRDVPAGNWAVDVIERATALGIVNGVDSEAQLFGFGQNVKRSEFVAMLTRLFGWEREIVVTPSFADCRPTSWYYDDVETAVAHGAVLRDSTSFRPEEYITREEMAVMLVRALGYETLAGNAVSFGHPFTDVTNYPGHITLAYDFGIINGVTPTTFQPAGYARREEAAAMAVRLYDRTHSNTEWLHAFYALSSYSQRELIADLDAVSFGWSRLEFSAADGVSLNTTTKNSNEFAVPAAADTAVDLAAGAGALANLSVYMSAGTKVTLEDGSASNPCAAILLSAERRTEAVDAILSELGRRTAAGAPYYGGVTIDFELMKGSALKEGFTLFLQELHAALEPGDLQLTVAVHPVWKNNLAYYDAYDYPAIGAVADRIILMAHDYAADTLSSSLMAAGYTTTPVTPFDDVYYALKAITDPQTGVGADNISKVALAVSIDSTGWMLQNGKVIRNTAMHPTAANLYARLISSNTQMNYSERYRNPYITYYDSTDSTDNLVWYEDSRSVSDKLALARMFGVTGVSVWRLGLVPQYEDPASRPIYYNIWQTILETK
ncbi:S-layer homology domain-containing protein [Feifania hominis]|uniref:S-layer homology domain-containing protein n=1 Tax=Feifania hominis TaxID=2763660 RepID=A0A926DEE5_9FIRM|nr:S-layer homology domain-containing protein [Feifania hominis]MBC8536686.1 S-layer homology domain-containing protein [Feifania hominis]